MTLFVLTDVHSFYNEMKQALAEKGFDKENQNHCVLICGDLFDRGPDAIKVFEFVKELAAKGRLFYVAGNHEELLFDCVSDIQNGNIGEHHFHNHTVDTISQFTGFNKYELLARSYDKQKFNEKMQEVLDFISNNCNDYYEIGNYVFVHGWIPCNPYNGEVAENWREGDWKRARWLNGMQSWHRGVRLEGKTIVCGHFHASWGHSHLHLDRKEFPQKNKANWQESFKPFEDEGIIALDACTVYSGFCNCLVIKF